MAKKNKVGGEYIFYGVHNRSLKSLHPRIDCKLKNNKSIVLDKIFLFIKIFLFLAIVFVIVYS